MIFIKNAKFNDKYKMFKFKSKIYQRLFILYNNELSIYVYVQ